MTLYVYVNEYYQQVLYDLATIVSLDVGGLSLDENSNPILIVYSSSLSAFSCELINDLANNITVNGSFFIVGADCSAYDNDGGLLCDDAGTEYYDQGSGSYIALYDVTQCNRQGYFVVDYSGNLIPFSNDALLFHELSHVYHDAYGDTASDPEMQAGNDENQYRGEKGYPLRYGHVGYCGRQSLSGAGSGTTSSGTTTPTTINHYCIIASAAYGSDMAPEVKTLRSFRDDFMEKTLIGKIFFTELFAEYYKFGSQIASDMVSSVLLKNSIRKLVVEPLWDFFNIYELYTRQLNVENAGLCSQTDSLKQEARKVLSRTRARFAEYGLTLEQQETVLRKIQSLQENIAIGTKGKTDVSKTRLPTKPLYLVSDANIVMVLDYFNQVFEETVMGNRYLTWALLEPLRIYWSCLVKADSKEEKSLKDVLEFFYSSIGDWLSVVPFPTSLASIDEESLKNDVAYLARNVFTDVNVRNKVGSRFLETNKNRFSFDLKKLLIETDYLTDIKRRKAK